MSKKIIGVTVGTTMSPSKLENTLKVVKTVNGVAPDGNGNVGVNGLKEVNNGSTYKMWVGTKAEYDAISVKNANTLYWLTDDDTYGEIMDEIDTTNENVSNIMTKPCTIELSRVGSAAQGVQVGVVYYSGGKLTNSKVVEKWTFDIDVGSPIVYYSISAGGNAGCILSMEKNTAAVEPTGMSKADIYNELGVNTGSGYYYMLIMVREGVLSLKTTGAG